MLHFFEHHPTPVAVLTSIMLFSVLLLIDNDRQAENRAEKPVVQTDTVCANTLFSRPTASDILSDIDEDGLNAINPKKHDLDGAIGFSEGGVKLAVVRKNNCMAVISTNRRFAEIYVGSMIQMPIH